MNFNDILEQIREIDYTSKDGENPHSHTYRIDRQGNGRTLETEGEGPDHIHEIRHGSVKPSGSDNHTHTLRER